MNDPCKEVNYAIRGRSRLALLLAGSIIAVTSSASALAQDGGATGGSGETASTGDIIVTATRVETSASKTPIALTAISGDQLIHAGITNATALGEQVPNLTINRNQGLQITIRGISSSDGSEKGDPSAAFMLDGTYLARPQLHDVSFFDISRIEVLRGPQGTLYGRNTTAGAINLITNRPTLDRFYGSADVSYGNYNATTNTLVLNAPVSSDFGVRLAVNYDRRDSYVNEGLNFPGVGQSAKTSPARNNISARLSTLYKFDRGELVVRADYSHMGGYNLNATGSGQVYASNFYSNYTTVGVDPTYIAGSRSNKELSTLNLPTVDGMGDSTKNHGLLRDSDTYSIGAEWKYDLGPVTANYLGSYRVYNRHEGGMSFSGNVLVTPNQYDGKFKQNSQELRFNTNASGPLTAQAGLYYFKETGSTAYFIFDRNLGNGQHSQPGELGYILGFPLPYLLNESMAAYGQATYAIIPSVRLTGGIRVTRDHKARSGQTVTCQYDTTCDAPGDLATQNDADVVYKKVTWKAGVDIDLDAKTLMYGSIATGYKAGGFVDGCQIGDGPSCTLAPSDLYYDPETLTAYEAGLKTKFFNNMLRLNLAAFHYDYKNLQLTSIAPCAADPSQNCNLTRNATSAKIDGVEVESTFQPGANDRLSLNGAWLHARYGQYIPDPNHPDINFAGRQLDRSPKWTFSGNYTHTFALPNDANIEANVHSRISSSYKLIALGILGQFTQPSYTMTDVSLTYNSPDRSWYVQAFGKNLEDKLVVTNASSGASGTVQIGDPRTYGVRAGLKF